MSDNHNPESDKPQDGAKPDPSDSGTSFKTASIIVIASLVIGVLVLSTFGRCAFVGAILAHA
jgi:hypothetical protein